MTAKDELGCDPAGLSLLQERYHNPHSPQYYRHSEGNQGDYHLFTGPGFTLLGVHLLEQLRDKLLQVI